MKADEILQRLEEAGFEAYYVGGCVRNTLMNIPVHDFDITTNALPEQVRGVFDGFTVIPTGIRHGTVTVLLHGQKAEVTTYRIDGNYTDNRHPDNVQFSADIITDLARRDFTMNAIAMDLRGKIIDPFNGISDIKSKIIRCVGNPSKRFSEDALRILRAVRFASQLGFEIENKTSNAVHDMRRNLSAISNERIRMELDKIICGKNCVEVLMQYSDVITAIIPEFSPCIGFEQHSDYHCYNVWEHIIRAMASAPADNLLVRRSLFFHDIAKPQCVKFDADGKGHFKGHAEVSSQIAQKIMKKLCYDNETIRKTYLIIYYHSDKIRNRADIKRMLNILGPQLFFEFIKMKKCDNSAKKEFVLQENKQLDEVIDIANGIILKNECYKLSQLEIDGNDLRQLGFEGAKIGEALNNILELIINDEIKNNKKDILDYLKGMKKY